MFDIKKTDNNHLWGKYCTILDFNEVELRIYLLKQ